MNIKLVLGITAAVFLAYVLFRQFAEQNATVSAYRKEIHNLLTNEKHQVKGRFE